MSPITPQTLMPFELSNDQISNIERFGVNYELRVLLHTNQTGGIYDVAPTSYYQFNGGDWRYYWFDHRLFIKRLVVFAPGNKTVCRVEYKDHNGNYVLAASKEQTTPMSFAMDLKYPIYTYRIRVKMYDIDDPSLTEKPTSILVYSDRFGDITEHITGEIKIENNSDELKREPKLPYTNIEINNKDGRWTKQTHLVSMMYHSFNDQFTHSAYEYLSSLAKEDNIVTVELKFLGENWEESSYILLSTFPIRQFDDDSFFGESGWFAKTEINSPFIEGIYPQDVIDNWLARKDGDLLIQLNTNDDIQVISSPNEMIGYTELEPSDANKFFDGKKIWSWCQDSRYIYYAVKNYSSPTTTGITCEIYRALSPNDETPELLGTINAVPYAEYVDAGRLYLCDGTCAIGQHPTIYNNLPLTRDVMYIFQMDVDDEYLYIPLITMWKGLYVYAGTVPPVPDYRSNPMVEPLIYKLRKDGVGWESICGSSVSRSGQSSYYGAPIGAVTPYTTSNVYSLGAWKYDYEIPGNVVVDPLDCSYTYWLPVFGGLTIVDDNGVDKLLVFKRMKRNDLGTNAFTEYRMIAKDFSTDVKVGESESDEWVISARSFSDIMFFVNFRTYAGQSKLGTLRRYGIGLDFYIDKELGVGNTAERCLSIGFLSDSFYMSGVNFQTSPSEVVDNVGIKELYRCVFNTDGYNICHKDSTRDEYINHPVPVVRVKSERLDKNYVEYGSEEIVDGEIYKTPGWILNLRSGKLILRQVYPTSDRLEIYIDYDFYNSIQFCKLESRSRLASDCLGKVSQMTDESYGVDESGSLTRLEGLKQKVIPLRSIVRDYSSYDSYDCTESNVILVTSIDAANAFMIGFQITPDFTGILEKIKIPIRCYQNGTVGSDVALDLKVYIANNTLTDVDCKNNGSGKPTVPPTQGQIELLTTSEIYISKPGVGNYTKYRWISIDVSAANFEVNKGQTYSIILRPEAPGFSCGYQYEILAKKRDAVYTANRAITASYNYGSDINSMPSSSWYVYYSFYDFNLLSEVEIRKTKQIISTNIVDSLNTTITNEFRSLLGGANSTIAVKSQDLLDKYTRNTHYQITKESGNYILNIIGSWSTIDTVVVVQWYETLTDILKLEDTKNSILEKVSHGNNTRYLQSIVKGTRKRIANSPAVVKKRFPLFSGYELELEADSEHPQELEIGDVKQWNDKDNIYDVVQEAKKFTFELTDPFITGSTKYLVRYGKGDAGDHVESGTVSILSVQDAPMFYKIVLSSPFSNDKYHVLIDQEQYKEWRLARADDYEDMLGNCYGGDPISSGDIFTSAHFYIKYMNRAFGTGGAKWIAYESELVEYYINEDGVVCPADNFTSESDENPIRTNYPNNTIYVEVTPIDLNGNPLFMYHSEGSKTGYNANANSAVKAYMSTRINRVNIETLGVSVNYSNFSDYKFHLDLLIAGYPVNEITRLRADRKLTGYEHADAMKIEIENDIIQNLNIARFIADRKIDIWGDSDIKRFQKEVRMDPRLRPSCLVIVTSEKYGFENHLFFCSSTEHLISVSEPLKTTLPNMRQI